jgi:general secretion pathway protein D
MNRGNNLRGICAFLAILMALAPALDARTRKGDKFLKQGQAAEKNKLWDEALSYYEKALATDGNDPAYMMAVRRTRFQASQQHVNLGYKLRQEGNLEAAAAEFQKAIVADPSSAIALQEWRRTTEMIEKAKSGEVPKGEISLTPEERYRSDEERRMQAMMPPPQLRPITGRIRSLKMNNQPPKILYETIGKLAGINVVFDPQYTPQGKGFNVDLNNTSLEQALDYLAVLTKTFWKPISSNTIFVTEDNVTKRRDYEDNVVRVFYVQNATSVQEFQEMATAVRSIAEIRRVFTYNAQRAIVLRGTPDQVALAEKLIHDLDKPKGEVVVDVLVLEANRSKTRDLAASLMSGTTAGLSVPITFTPRDAISIGGGSNGTNTNQTGTTTTNQNQGGNSGSTGILLSRIGNISTKDFATTLPGALLQLLMSDRQTRVLQSPQVRASDGQKVTLRIGDKIPFASGSFQPGIGTVGVSPLVSTQFQFAEVGVNVDITPQVVGDDEVNLKVAVEVSNVRDRVDIGGIEQPIIGQRKTETEIRLKQGEVNILGGLTQDQDTKSIAGVPGLVNIPLLGRLLGGESTTRDTGQLLIALIPHIVRTPNLSTTDLKGILAGTDQVVRVQYAPEPAPPAAPGAAPAPEAPAPTEPAPAAPPPAKPETPAAAGPRMTFLPPAVQTQVGGNINVTIQVDNIEDLFAATPVRIKYDPARLRLNDIVQGELMTRDGQKTTFSKDIRNDAGEAWFNLNRLPGSGGISGSGTLVTLSFTALASGQTNVAVTESSLKNTQLQPITVPAATVQINVQ